MDYWKFYAFKQQNNSILLTEGGKVKNAQNHKQIDARGEVEGIKPVIYGILYYQRRWVYYFSSLPGAKVAIEFSAADAKLPLCVGSEEKIFSSSSSRK